MSEFEQCAIGCDHADIGGWQLERWAFPERQQQAVTLSHTPESVCLQHKNGLFIRSVAPASRIAEVFLAGSR